MFFIKVPKDKEEPKKFKEFLKKTKETFKNEGKWLFVIFLLGAFVMLILFAVLFFLSDYLEKTHDIKGIKKGFVLAIPLLFLCICSFITGKKIKGSLPAMKKINIVSLLILSVSVAGIGFTKDKLVLLIVVASILGMAIGTMLPALDAMITENIEKGERGTITSFYSSARFIGVAAGPPIMTVVIKNHLNMTFISAGILGVLMVLLVCKFIEANSPEKTKQAA